MQELVKGDVLIIGGGIAGGIAAYLLAEKGVSVVLANRASEESGSNTWYAQGGIIYTHPDDTPQKCFEDINHAGDGICFPDAVRQLCEQGPGYVRDILIEALGIEFDRDADGRFSQIAEGGHSVPRIIHSADATGKAIQNALIDRLQNHPNIHFLNGFTAIDLLTPEHHSLDRLSIYEPRRCVGAYLLEQSSGRVSRAIASNTILATGGLGRIFLRTTNPVGARGDGIAMANRAGARIINLEYVQFHPTALFHPGATSFLISEAARGAGARLMNGSGEYFMERYDAEWRDLAPRDVVARAIHYEMLNEDSECVYLDFASFLTPEKIVRKFPTIYAFCKKQGFDITQKPLPVVPSAHYSCGGIWVDLKGRTTIENLYAVGEVSCTGLHGANRLASSSLLEGLVWAAKAAEDIMAKDDRPLYEQSRIPPWDAADEFEPDPALIAQDFATIRNIMWNYVGLVRNRHRLQRAHRELRQLEQEIERFYRKTKLADALIGLRNAVRTAVLVTSAAWENRKSRGCHYRED